jgi:coiled-coil and C2 domain-containing protein 1
MEGPVITPAQSSETPPSETTIRNPENPSTIQPPTSTLIPAQSQKISPTKTPLATRQDKQLAMLLERQSLFKQAALEAKKSNEIELAKEYLRMSKGIDPLISANKCGVPVDMDTVILIYSFVRDKSLISSYSCRFPRK